MAGKKNMLVHWPTILLGLLVALILVVAIVTYQVHETESVVVTTLGEIRPDTPAPGLHFRLPYPIQRVYTFDKRMRSFSGSGGKIEETPTADNQNVLIGIFVNYRIDNPQKFFVSFQDIPRAESELNTWMRGAKLATIGRYPFNQLINTDPKKMKLDEIQDEIKRQIAEKAAPNGIAIEQVGIHTINVPPGITEKVFERMIEDRKRAAREFLATGDRRAKETRTAADSARAQMLAEAEAEAKKIRAEGDAEAATYYSIFKESPELAIFLRKLDALNQIMQSRATLVFDTNTAPFDLLRPGSELLKQK